MVIAGLVSSTRFTARACGHQRGRSSARSGAAYARAAGTGSARTPRGRWWFQTVRRVRRSGLCRTGSEYGPEYTHS
jgi:hypothetical protein